MNLNANWQLKIRDKVWKDVAEFPKKDQERIESVIENEIGLDPYFGDIKKMKGEDNSWRRRIGAYRIFYEIIPQEKTIYVFNVERRTSKTYQTMNGRECDEKADVFDGKTRVKKDVGEKVIEVVYSKDNFRDKKEEYIIITAYYIK